MDNVIPIERRKRTYLLTVQYRILNFSRIQIVPHCGRPFRLIFAIVDEQNYTHLFRKTFIFDRTMDELSSFTT